MKTERITILASPDFKALLAKEAQKEGVSISELVRKRCSNQPYEDAELLSLLVEELRESNKSAEKALDSALVAVDQALETIQRLRHEKKVAKGVAT